MFLGQLAATASKGRSPTLQGAICQNLSSTELRTVKRMIPRIVGLELPEFSAATQRQAQN